MGKINFTEEQIELLKKNPCVSDVSERNIVYTNEFKERFMDRYFRGEHPVDIFNSCGLNVAVLGKKRIMKCAERWTDGRERGTLTLRKEISASRPGKAAEKLRKKKEEKNLLKEQVRRQEEEIQKLMEEIKRIKKGRTM